MADYSIRLRVFVLLVLFGPMLGPVSTFGQAEQKLFATDVGASQEFGYSVSISGNVAIVGSPNHGMVGNEPGPGAAYIYRLDGDTWIRESKMLASDLESGASFGQSVAILGDVALIGASEHDDNGYNTGTAYIYRYNGSEWVYQQRLSGPSGEFGYAVALGRDLAIVSSPRYDGATGAVQVFRYDGFSWIADQMLYASNGESHDRFGTSLSLSNDVLVVGSPLRDLEHPTNPYAGSNAGSAYVFRFDGSAWNETKMLTASDLGTSNQFGIDLSVDGENLVVGSHQAHDMGFQSGNAYLFKHDGSEFVEVGKLIASDGTDNDHFGTSVSLSGNTSIIGSPRDGKGSAYTYDLSQIITSNESASLPIERTIQLGEVYPNPFRTWTIVSYSLPRPSNVRLHVFDLLGKRVRVLESGFKTGGEHEVTFDATGLPSGIYFYTLTAGNFSQTRKMVLLNGY